MTRLDSAILPKSMRGPADRAGIARVYCVPLLRVLSLRYAKLVWTRATPHRFPPVAFFLFAAGVPFIFPAALTFGFRFGCVLVIG